MIVCLPIDGDGVGGSWGRAARVAVARVVDGQIEGWEEFAVGWDELHDEGTEGGHHARIARFLRDHDVEAVVAGHMGPPMQQMLSRMGLRVLLGAQGSGQAAALAIAATAS